MYRLDGRFYPRDTPNIIVTTFVGNAFLDWYEISGDSALLATAAAAVRYLNEELLGSGEGAYYSYVPRNRVLVHNANLLGCALTSRVARLSEDTELQILASKAAQASLEAQLHNGLWPYGRERGLQWVDSFHTAYVLDGLCELCATSPDETLHNALRAGFAAYTGMLFGPRGEPRYTPTSLYPVDIHSAATAIDVLSRRREAGAGGLDACSPSLRVDAGQHVGSARVLLLSSATGYPRTESRTCDGVRLTCFGRSGHFSALFRPALPRGRPVTVSAVMAKQGLCPLLVTATTPKPNAIVCQWELGVRWWETA